jgi:hypothetical protein
MRVSHEEVLISSGDIEKTREWQQVRTEIYQAITAVVWPPGSSQFTINPVRNGNGVKPMKAGCMVALQSKFSWTLEAPVFIREVRRAGKVDALRQTSVGDFIFEWETGNISSSHRALNKIALGLIRELVLGGVLVLPTRKLYPYLTDRIGNYEELRPYFPVWRSIPIKQGVMIVIAIEHDATDPQTPLIQKGTDGRALI